MELRIFFVLIIVLFALNCKGQPTEIHLLKPGVLVEIVSPDGRRCLAKIVRVGSDSLSATVSERTGACGPRATPLEVTNSSVLGVKKFKESSRQRNLRGLKAAAISSAIILGGSMLAFASDNGALAWAVIGGGTAAVTWRLSRGTVKYTISVKRLP